jgi:hypothetical protein
LGNNCTVSTATWAIVSKFRPSETAPRSTSGKDSKGAIANSAQSINLLMEFTECRAGSEHSRPFHRGREGDAGIGEA